MAARKNTRTQARRSGANNSGGGIKPMQVFVIGAVVGAAALFAGPKFLDKEGDGFLRPKPNAEAVPSQPLASEQVVADGEAVVAKNTPAEPIEEGTEFDFYNMLPNKEVEMTPEQQAALNRAQQRRVEYAQRQERLKAEKEASFASASPDTAQSTVEIMPDMAPPVAVARPALPKPVTVTTPTAPRSAPPAEATKPAVTKPLPKPVASVAAPKPAAPVAAATSAPSAKAHNPIVASQVAKRVKDRPVVAAATSAAEAPKPKAKAAAAYAKNPDVTLNAKGVAMVMPKAATTAAPAKTVVASAAPSASKVLLQAGAYGDQGQAEKVKAKIAMLGLGARVEESTSGGKNVYRVRLGPYAENSAAMDTAKRKLTGGGLSAMEVRVN